MAEGKVSVAPAAIAAGVHDSNYVPKEGTSGEITEFDKKRHDFRMRHWYKNLKHQHDDKVNKDALKSCNPAFVKLGQCTTGMSIRIVRVLRQSCKISPCFFPRDPHARLLCFAGKYFSVLWECSADRNALNQCLND